jgi:hypothetical protein
MKTAFIVAIVLWASAAFAQTAGSSVSAQPQVYSFESHPEHARRTPLAQAQDLIGGESNVSAHGERPLWELAATPVQEVPLGDSARALREQHLAAKKSLKCWQN